MSSRGCRRDGGLWALAPTTSIDRCAIDRASTWLVETNHPAGFNRRAWPRRRGTAIEPGRPVWPALETNHPAGFNRRAWPRRRGAAIERAANPLVACARPIHWLILRGNDRGKSRG